MELAITFLGMAITLLSAVLTYLAWKNGRWMKEANERVEKVIQDGNLRVERLIAEEARLTREMVEKITAKLGEWVAVQARR